MNQNMKNVCSCMFAIKVFPLCTTRLPIDQPDKMHRITYIPLDSNQCGDCSFSVAQIYGTILTRSYGNVMPCLHSRILFRNSCWQIEWNYAPWTYESWFRLLPISPYSATTSSDFRIYIYFFTYFLRGYTFWVLFYLSSPLLGENSLLGGKWHK